ncbi:MAG: hypothetical protein Q4D15_06850 [Lachnospiraceae bacterium]|nr:hypothetical protein [Lachnospiraceae bacterium]
MKIKLLPFKIFLSMGVIGFSAGVIFSAEVVEIILPAISVRKIILVRAKVARENN